jgi:hypothetical protein
VGFAVNGNLFVRAVKSRVITVKFIGIAESGNDTGSPVTSLGERTVVQGRKAEYLVKGQLVEILKSADLSSVYRLGKE